MRSLSPSWQAVVGDEFDKPYFNKLVAFLRQERSCKTVFPSDDEVFRALDLVPYHDVRVLLLGQDPYHNGAIFFESWKAISAYLLPSMAI